MLSVFVPADFSLKKVAAADLAELPENAVWIDLVKPTTAEDKAVERLAGIAVPTREDMQEIEISSRLYIENSARYMTATLMCAADTENPRTTAVTFILASHRLVTVRYDQPKPFMLVENKLARACAPGVTGEMVLMELLDAVIDRNADILERAGSDMDNISHDIFEP
jgi:magnesium transporter